MKKSVITRQYILGLINDTNKLRETLEEEPQPSIILPGLILSGKSFERNLQALKKHGVIRILQVPTQMP
jgi:glycerol-3-phosphate responsive antiterminator